MDTFLATTTAHGLNRINVENRFRRLLWRFICVLLYGGCLCMIAQVIKQVNYQPLYNLPFEWWEVLETLISLEIQGIFTVSLQFVQFLLFLFKFKDKNVVLIIIFFHICKDKFHIASSVSILAHQPLKRIYAPRQRPNERSPARSQVPNFLQEKQLEGSS